MEAGMVCMIDGETFFSFMENMWIHDLGSSCHIIKHGSGLYDMTNINKLVQGSWGNMPAMKKGNIHMKVSLVNESV